MIEQNIDWDDIKRQARYYGAQVLSELVGLKCDPARIKFSQIRDEAELDVCMMHMEGTELLPAYERAAAIIVEHPQWVGKG